MGKEDARQLFSLHAFSHPHLARGYEDIFDDFVHVCGDLPLSLQVLGRHVRGRNEYYWRSVLKKLGGGKLHPDIKKKLQLKSIAIKVWEASGWNAIYGLQTLKDKCLVQEFFEDECLVEEIDDHVPVLRMHDHLRDLGREMANEPNHPPRLWHPWDLQKLAPSQLREVKISGMFLGEFPNFLGILTNVEKEVIEGEYKAAIEALPLVESSPTNLHVLDLNDSRESGTVKAPLSLLEDLAISEQENIIKIIVCGNLCPKLKSLELFCMKNLIEVNISNCEVFERFNCLKISNCEDLKRLSVTSNLTKLEELNISACSQLEEASFDCLGYLKRITIADCNLRSVPRISCFRKLLELNISKCSMLHGLSLA
ncbi:hypothetical protein SUGI_0400410 [Cryptomeria japonica]|nr:hypothetical protein SUGI_0400410 [Cryptomeria japonica]